MRPERSAAALAGARCMKKEEEASEWRTVKASTFLS